MRLFLLPALFGLSMAEICIRLLANEDEFRVVKKIPGRIWMWNKRTGEFEELEAYTQNETAVCSVDKSSDVEGKSLIAVADDMYPYITLSEEEREITGFLGDVWTTLEETLNFTTIYRRTSSDALEDDSVDAFLVPTAIHSYTSSYYTYSVSVATNSYALFVQSAGTSVSKWWYASIFSSGLWLTTIIFVVCLTMTIMATYALKRTTLDNYTECDNELSSPSFNLLYVLGGISGQGFQKLPSSWSLRLLSLSYLIMGMLLSCGFSSTLTSYLAFRSTSIPLANLEDVAQKKTHALCMRNDSSAYIHFTHDAEPNGQLLSRWKGIVNKGCPNMKDSSTLSSKLCRPGVAYLEAPDIFMSFYRKVQRNCRIVQVPGKYWSLKIAFLLARTSKYRNLIDTYLMRFRSAGILKYLEKKWISTELESPTNHWSSFQPVEYAHIHLASLGLFIMMLVSAAICILENLWCKLQEKFKKPESRSTSVLVERPKYYTRILKTSRKQMKIINRRKFTVDQNRKCILCSYLYQDFMNSIKSENSLRENSPY